MVFMSMPCMFERSMPLVPDMLDWSIPDMSCVEVEPGMVLGVPAKLLDDAGDTMLEDCGAQAPGKMPSDPTRIGIASLESVMR